MATGTTMNLWTWPFFSYKKYIIRVASGGKHFFPPYLVDQFFYFNSQLFFVDKMKPQASLINVKLNRQRQVVEDLMEYIKARDGLDRQRKEFSLTFL